VSRIEKGTIVPMATAPEDAEDFQISSITMCARCAETTWPYATTVASLTAKRGSSERKSCNVIQPTAEMMTTTKHARSHFTDKYLTRIRWNYSAFFYGIIPSNLFVFESAAPGKTDSCLIFCPIPSYKTSRIKGHAQACLSARSHYSQRRAQRLQPSRQPAHT
jgi:hypothetical protein